MDDTNKRGRKSRAPGWYESQRAMHENRDAWMDSLLSEDENVTRGPMYSTLTEDLGVTPRTAGAVTLASQYAPIYGTIGDIQDVALYAKSGQPVSAGLSAAAAGLGVLPFIGALPKMGLKTAAKEAAKYSAKAGLGDAFIRHARPNPKEMAASTASWLPYQRELDDDLYQGMMTAP